MKTAVMKGVPLSMQRDGWWMDGVKPPSRKRTVPADTNMSKALFLLAMIAFGDAMVWHVWPGLSLAVLTMAIVGAAMLLAPGLTPRRKQFCFLGTVMAVLPVVELMQPLSVLMLCFGVLVVLCGIAQVNKDSFPRAMLRYPWFALVFSARDFFNCLKATSEIPVRKTSFRDLVMVWAIPVCLGLVFLTLFSGANPILDKMWTDLFNWQVPQPNMSRLWFWMFLGLVIWSAFIAPRLLGALTARKPERQTVRRPGLINPHSLIRSMVLFNLMFAGQTVMDFVFLYGATDLPDGMTYATYAHRGAYPLLVTALLAGGFAVLVRPLTDNAPVLRLWLIVWLIQNLFLVVASATRLDAYIDAYGLTRLRLAAAIWMSVVFMGILLVLWQVHRQHSTSWLLIRNAALAVVTLYLCCFISFDRMIARHNFSGAGQQDYYYLCSLGESVLPEMSKNGFDAQVRCPDWRRPQMSEPKDWREWGFRNWRMRRSLARVKVKDAAYDPYR